MVLRAITTGWIGNFDANYYYACAITDAVSAHINRKFGSSMVEIDISTAKTNLKLAQDKEPIDSSLHEWYRSTANTALLNLLNEME